MPYYSTKTYGHERGLSAAFRQWRAESHCKYLHGYSLAFKFTFGADQLDHRNWVVDFGSLKSLKGTLDDLFDHKTLVAHDDPNMPYFKGLDAQKVIQLRVVENTGCEAFAEAVWHLADTWLVDNGYSPLVWVDSVEVMEHGANSAIFKGVVG